MILTINDLYFSEVDEKLEHARNLHNLFGTELRVEPHLSLHLKKVRRMAREMREEMGDMAMFDLCIQCGSRPGGGCCSLYMANETDAILLLINLLLGSEVSLQRDDGFECFFLGETGCTLICKPFFCLNYNCRKILDRGTTDELNRLEKATGRILRAQNELEEMILSFLKHKNCFIPTTRFDLILRCIS